MAVDGAKYVAQGSASLMTKLYNKIFNRNSEQKQAVKRFEERRASQALVKEQRRASQIQKQAEQQGEGGDESAVTPGEGVGGGAAEADGGGAKKGKGVSFRFGGTRRAAPVHAADTQVIELDGGGGGGEGAAGGSEPPKQERSAAAKDLYAGAS